MVYQIDDTTAVASQPALPTDSIGTPGFFTGGSTSGGAPTRVRYWWLNMVQQELLNIALAAGLTADKTDNTQCITAIKALAKQAASGAVLGSPGVLATGDVAGGVLYYSAALAAPAFTYGTTTVGLATTTALTSALGKYLPLAGGALNGPLAVPSLSGANGALPIYFGPAAAPCKLGLQNDGNIVVYNAAGTPVFSLDANTGNCTFIAGTVTVPDAAAAKNPVTLEQLLSYIKNGTGLGQLHAATGYQALPGGLIIQWGNQSAGTNGLSTVTYPIAFPNACVELSLVEANASGSWPSGLVTLHGVYGAKGVASSQTYSMQFSSGSWAGKTGIGFNWLAIGY